MKHFLLLISVLIAFASQAQWSSDPAVNIPISNPLISPNSIDALNPCALSDGHGGAFIMWGNTGTIFGQKLDANGNIQWNAGGISIGSSGRPGYLPSLQNPMLISDDSGGAIITWMETSQGIIGASRVKPDGTVEWDKLVCNYSGYRTNPVLVSDGAGGAIITWRDGRNGSSNVDIYAQRMSATGEVMWDAKGIAVCAATGNQDFPSIASDGNGGTFITWDDLRTASSQVYVQRINSLGLRQWQENGIPACGTTNPSGGPKIAATAPGEAIIVWNNGTPDGTGDIFAQKVNLNTLEWAATGIPVCNAISTQSHPEIVADGFGGAIISWNDTRVSLSNGNIYAQSISSGGLVQWPTNGIPICTQQVQALTTHAISSDGSGGAIFAWADYRSGSSMNSDVYAQRVNHGGSTLWTPNGIPVCIAPQYQQSITVIANGNGGAILAWIDFRNNTNWVIYAQGVQADGSLGGTTSAAEKPMANGFSLNQNYPNPFHPSTKISWQSPISSWQTLKVYDILGNEVATLVNEEKAKGNYEVNFNSNGLPDGVYFYKLQAGSFVETKKMILTK